MTSDYITCGGSMKPINQFFLFAAFLIASAFATAAQARPSICGDDFTEAPILQVHRNGTFSLCSVVPSAYITPKEAIKAAKGANKAAAKEYCNGARAVKIGKAKINIPSP